MKCCMDNLFYQRNEWLRKERIFLVIRFLDFVIGFILRFYETTLLSSLMIGLFILDSQKDDWSISNNLFSEM